jgi:hypothetical protein
VLKNLAVSRSQAVASSSATAALGVRPGADFIAGLAGTISRSVSLKSFRITFTFSSDSSPWTTGRGDRDRLPRAPGCRDGSNASGFNFLTHAPTANGLRAFPSSAGAAGRNSGCAGWMGGNFAAGVLAASAFNGFTGSAAADSNNGAVSNFTGPVARAADTAFVSVAASGLHNPDFGGSLAAGGANGFFDDPNFGSATPGFIRYGLVEFRIPITLFPAANSRKKFISLRSF